MRSRKERPEGFVIYSQTLKSACLLPDDSAGRVFKAVSRFFLEQEEPEDLDLSEQIVFSLMHSDVVSSLERHTETCQRNQRIAKNRASNGHDTSRVVTSGDDSSRTELNGIERNRIKSEFELNENEASKPPRAPRFSPPSVEEVRAYCQERGNGIDAQRFVDFYEANGWTQGRGKSIKNWRAAVRTWERRENNGSAADHGKPESSSGKRFNIKYDVE